MWKPLKSGDIVDMVLPASACERSEIEKAKKYLESLGLVPRVPKDILSSRKGFFSNSDDYRFEHLKESFKSDSKAIWCLRGGYGSLRLLPQLERLKKPKTQKLFIGLSDVASLHIFLNQKWNWQTIHGPMLGRMGRGDSPSRERKEVRDLLFGNSHEIAFKNLKPMNLRARKNKSSIRGKVAGGNLLVVHSAQGTPWELKGQGKIIFLEEINERGYRVDRTLVSLTQGGLFDNAKAVIFGDFIGGSEPDGRTLWREALRDFSEKIRLPVFSGLHSGHGKLQRPLPLNSPSVLNKGTLTCHF